MNILLVSLQGNTDTIGLKYIHSYLLGKGYNSHLLFLGKVSPALKPAIENFMQDLKPAAIGISLMSHEYFRAVELTAFLKERFPKTPVIWGGIHPTIAPEECVVHADAVCLGEGEEVMLQVAEAIKAGRDFRGVGSLAYRSVDAVKSNALFPLKEDIDDFLPIEHLPRNSFAGHGSEIMPLDNKLFKQYARFDGLICSVITSRGCPFSCTYCCNNYLTRLYNSRKVRRRSVGGIIDELKQVVKEFPKMRYINIQDDCFLACGLDWLNEFAGRYAREVKVPFIIRTIPTFLSEEKLVILKKAGLAWVSMGLQSGSDRVCRDVYQRNIRAQDFLAAARVISRNKLAAFYDVILDNPFETKEDIMETIRVMSQIPRPYSTQVFSLTLYKGTALYDRAQKEIGAEDIDDAHEKEYLKFRKSLLNKLVRITPLLPRGLAVRMAAGKEGSFFARAILNPVYFFSLLFVEPWVYFQTIRMAEGGSYFRALSAMWLLAKDRMKISLQIYG